MSNQIIGNTEYKAIKEKAYINGTQENIMRLAEELDKAGINYSGRVSNYRSAVTVEEADRARTLEIMKVILNEADKKIPAANSEKNIIGNAEYRYIYNKRYVRGETEAMLRTADRLTAENISFSGRINGDTVTLTVSGDETQELAKKYFAEEKNRIENIQPAYFLALSTDTFEDGYYFSEVNMSTGEEIAPYRSKFGDISMFLTVDEAEQYARVTGITLSNTAEQLNEWRMIEIEAEKEKDRQLNLSRSREIIKRLPMSEKGYEEHFVLRDEAVDWIYFNPDGADGEGQFVQTTLYADDILEAYKASQSADSEKSAQNAFIEVMQNGKQTVINADTADFEFLADTFIKSRDNENVIVSAPIAAGQDYDNKLESIINILENHFEDVRNYKENHITAASEDIFVNGFEGRWNVIDSDVIEGRKLFLLENITYVRDLSNIIVDENKNFVMADSGNGFNDYRDSIRFNDGKQSVSRDLAVELWENGFTVFMNDRNNALSDISDDPSLFELFTEEKNNVFYAFNKDIAQQRFLDDTVTMLDELNDASMREASHTENAIDTIDDYAKEMSEDGECAYKWSDGLTEWQNISASILSGDTEYIYSWLRDLRSVLPSLEENHNVSVDTALNYLNNYEKQYSDKFFSADELKKGMQLVYNNINWEVAHVNNFVIALKNLDSNTEMSSVIIENWQNTLTRNNVKFIVEKENSIIENNAHTEAAESNNKKTLIINAFGGPGAGKSTACLHITSELKKRGFVAEYVSEYAKDLVWDKNFEMLDGGEKHQKMILEEQKKRMDRLIGQVDFVVTDAPILLNSVYLNSGDKRSYDKALVNLFNQYDNFNLEVIRDVNKFEEEGRIHNLKQSQQADNDIRNLLNTNNIYFGIYSHGKLDKIVDNAIVTYNKLADKPVTIPEIPNRLSINSPVGKYVPDENLPLSKQLYELAKMELVDYENSLDTAEKAKAAAYELSVKRDILSYIEYDLAADITDSDVEDACRRLISTGYPLDTFYQDWLKNEYDNRMEAIRMTAEDTFRKTVNEAPENNIDKALQLDENSLVFSVVSINGGDDIVVGEYIDGESVRYMEEYLTAVSETNSDTLDVQVHFYTIGSIDTESIEADEAQVKYISEHLNDVLKQAALLESETYSVEIADKEIENSDRIIPERNFEFTVVTFEDDSVYVLAGKVDDDNIVGTAAYEDMIKNNFDIDKMESLEENIKVEYAVYRTGDDEAVMLTETELAEIRNNLDKFIGDKDPVSTEYSYLYPWKNVDDILYGLEKLWKERHRTAPQILDDSGSFYSLLPDSLNPSGESGGIKYYDTYSSVKLIKLKGRDEWLNPIDTAVEMNRRGVDLNDIEMLDVNAIDEFNKFSRREITPEQFAVYELQIDNDPESYNDKLEKYKTIVKTREAAHNAGLPFRNASAEEDNTEDFNPYAFDGTMSPEDYELMHKLMREDSFEIYQVKSGEEYHNKRFASLSELDGTPNIADYDLVFSGSLSDQDITAENKNEILEAVFDKFNNDRPEEFKGHSLSVSNIVVLHKNDEETAHYVDTMGFSDVPEFLKERVQEHDRSNAEETELETSPLGTNEILKVGDIVTFADKPNSEWIVAEISDIKIEFANTDTEAAEKYFSHIDFGVGRDNLQNTLGYTVITSVSAENTRERQVHNAFQRLKNSHDFTPEVIKLLDRVEKHIVSYDEENFSSKIFEIPLFEQTYGKVSRVNEKLFGGELRSVIDEVNGYIFEENIPNKELLSESDLSMLREIKAEHDRSNAAETEKSEISNQIVFEMFGGGAMYFRDEEMNDLAEISTDGIKYYTELSENDKKKIIDKANELHYPTVNSTALKEAKQHISEFCGKEYGSMGDFSDLHNVSLAYTTLTDDELPIQVTADLIDFKIIYEFDGKVFNEEKYDSLEAMNENALSCLDFDELVSIPFNELDKLENTYDFVTQNMEEKQTAKFVTSIRDKYDPYHTTLFYEYRGHEYQIENFGVKQPLGESIKEQHKREQQQIDDLIDNPTPILPPSNDVENAINEFLRYADDVNLKTISNQYNSFLIVQDTVYAFKDLLNGTAENYDWKNYAEAFKNVLDSNIHTDVSIPLYKSETYEIIQSAAERKEISADKISNALSNLELVLQNSHLLKNPEEKVEQISFFDSTPSRKSSDEIGFYSSVSEVPQDNTSPVGNNETQKNEKSFAEQVDESLNGTLNQYTSLKVCDTPKILLDVGCEQLPMLYTQRHLRNAISPKEDNNIHKHGLTLEMIKSLPQLISEPAMIYDSLSRNDSIILVTTATDSDNLPVIVSVKPNGNGVYELERINSNFITSVHGRENFTKQFTNAVENDKMLYLNKNKSQELFSCLGLQLPEAINNLSSDNIIHQSKNIVNTPKPKNNDYTITDKNYGAEGGAKTRFANNVAAIKLLKEIESENRTATSKEQEVLAKYVGWGGIPEAFDSSKDNWKKEYAELKNLLTDEEYIAARASTLNAHYTSPTVINAIYSGLESLGFDGGKILEPAMGIGNFFGAMPESLHNNSKLYGVELDSITGRIAKLLYPSANVQIKGYEKTDFTNGSFDVAVGNVPFGGYKVNDKEYNKQNFFIHDYFFAKTLDKVRAGGIIAFVTSKGTLDKESPEVRKYLAERAGLLGAIRLPNNAFKANAGTEVTSDIIFLQKRERPISIEENPPEWIYKDMLPNGIAVNKYFADHPEMILGEMVEGNKLYGNQTDASMCVAVEGADLEKQLAEAVKNIKGTYIKAEKEIADVSPLGNSDEIPCPPNAPKYSFIVQDDILYYHKANDTMEKYNAPEKITERIKAMVQLRDSVHSLLDLQLDNTDGSLDDVIAAAQQSLNDSYDNFSAKYGLISSAENRGAFRNDNSYHLIKALEKLDKDGNFIGKADIFSKITVNPKIIVDHCDNAQDALILSLSEKMCVNLEYMSILTGKSEEELIDELGDKIFQNPQKFMRWESADEYLTGNIRQKLAAAEAEGLTRNAEALRAVMPKRIEAADIAVKLGSAWVDPDYIRQFIVETLKPDFITSKNIEVTYMPATDKWKVEGWRSAYENTLASETYGIQEMKAYEIIEATLNMQKAEIRQRVKDEYGNDLRDSKGRYVYEVNQQKTMIVQAKQDELKRKFSDWIFSDPDRREKLVDVYNEKFNSIRLREYDGSHLNFVGMNSAITLKEHQKNAVARGLYSNGNTLLAHEVGAGKTYEMIAIAMEGKRLGLHHKSLITAPNGLTEQWGNAFRTLYPNANVLVATEKDFQKENRRDLFAKIATGDWDAVIIGHSQFDMIHLSRERELDGLYSEIGRLEEALQEMNDGEGKKSFSVKQIEKSIKTYQDKVEKLLAKTPEDDMLCFEKLGVDKIFVDESQAYKNLDTPTKMRNVSGIGSGGSGRSMQLLMKCKYLDEITGGKGCTFASGTPISNSMSEMYTLMRYLQADKLADCGINSFDRWASVFGETTTAMELSPEGNGKYHMKTRFAKFQNLPELMNIFKECADIKTAESLDLDRPDFEMHNVNVPATAIQSTMIKDLGERAKDIRAGDVDPTEDNMCKLTVDGRKIGLDQRCMNPNLPDDPKSKVNVCINNVFDIWQKTAEQKSTQLIFCDLATPQPTLNENTYTIYRKNPKGGYSDVYSAKLGEKDTAEKIMKKLNGKKPPKNYEAGDVSDGDIIMLKRVSYEEETAYNTAFEVVDGKLTEISPETWEKLHHAPTEHFESERRFCVYDDIKQKLISKGVPEKEIAFIHDADKAEDKQKLYDEMNKGEIRVLIGSTSKCGAGMNAQERMIALHDLDAPMRPSDMEQRHGRIIRQGNTNSKVDIYRYTTDKTFDAYLYQMLENKQRFISQIMTDKSPVRSCEDVDEVALDYAEVKALCAGNPLIREKIDLETAITKLNVLKSAFLSQKYSLQDKAYKKLPEHRKYTEHYIEKLKADIEAVKSVKPLTNEDGKNYYPVTVGGKEYHNKEEAGQAIRQAIINSSELTEKKQCSIGSYRGFEMTAFLETKWEGYTTININLKGACGHSCEINMNNDVKASGNIVRLDNVINGIALELQKQEDRLQSLNADIKEAEIAAEAVFPQEQELIEKEKRLAEVNTLLTNSEVRMDNSMELYAALVEICPELESYDTLYCKYEKGEDSGIEPLIVEKNGDTVFIAHTYVQNGDLMYDPAMEFSFDTKNHRAQALSYELSGMGIYEDLRNGNLTDKREDAESMALDVMFENIKAYGYERTEFNAEDRETEKEIGDDFER